MCVGHPRLSYVSTRSLIIIDTPRASYHIHAHGSRCIHSAHGLEGILDFFIRTYARAGIIAGKSCCCRSISYFCFPCLIYVWLQFFASSDVITHPSIQFFFLSTEAAVSRRQALKVLTCPRRILSFRRPDQLVSQSRSFTFFLRCHRNSLELTQLSPKPRHRIRRRGHSSRICIECTQGRLFSLV